MDNPPALKFPMRITPLKINIAKSASHKKITIKGIDIYFPHEPYLNQLIYMEKVIDSLDSQSYAALESPTGTGKTLCLLCASLAWLKSHKNKGTLPHKKIFYTSRTHSQLKQVFKELKTTCYEPVTSIISSRDNLCVNSALKDMTGEKKNLFCQIAKRRNQCPYILSTENFSEEDFQLCDIEELYQLGKGKMFCPFYYQKNKIKDCDIVLMPYNYIFEPDIRKAFNLELNNVIVIVDEAHNMTSVCEDGVSCDLSESILHDCVKDLEQLYIELINPQRVLNPKSLLHSINAHTLQDDINIIKNLSQYLHNFNLSEKTFPISGLVLQPKEMFDFFFEGSKANHSNMMMSFVGKTNEDYAYITPNNIKNHLKNIDLIIRGIKDEYEKTTRLSDLVRMLDLVNLFYLDYEANKNANVKDLYVNSFTFYINTIEDKMNLTKKQNGLFFYCFNPGFGFKLIQKASPYSFLITSGTLAPITGLESELKCPFPIQLENSHVADYSQINFSIITKSSDIGYEFQFDKNSRNNTLMINELGKTILDLSKVTPGGMLVFFPSYSFMNDCYAKWVSNEDILSKLSQCKTIFKDKQNTKESQEVIRQFKESNLNSKLNRKGGLLLSVCRGSSSEGLDFSDDYARMVIVVGIPYANLGSDKVQLKKMFLDKYKYDINLKNTLNGSQWYTNDAILSVNQSLGRVIRHKDDYGSMVVIDSRYINIFNRRLFSGWLNKCGRIYLDNSYLKDLKEFYGKMKAISLSIQMAKETNDRDRLRLKWTDWQSSTINEIDNNTSHLFTAKKHWPIENEDEDNDVDEGVEEDKNKKKFILFNSLKTPSDEKGRMFLNHKKKINQSITNPVHTPSTSIPTSSVKRINNYPIFPSCSNDKSKKVNKIQMKISDFMNNNNNKKTFGVPLALKEEEIIYIPSDNDEEIKEAKNDNNNNNIKKLLEFTPVQSVHCLEDNIHLVEDSELNSSKLLQKLREIKKESESSFKNLLSKFDEEIKSKQYEKTTSIDGGINPSPGVNPCYIPPMNQGESNNKKRYECPVCFDSNKENPSINFSSSKCGHVLCDDCWDKSLQNRLECPLCKHKVRANTLTKLFLI